MNTLMMQATIAVAGSVLALGMLATVEAAAPAATGGLKVTHVDAAGAAKLLEQKKVVVLDVRTPEEYREGYVAGAKLVDFKSADFEKKLAVLDRTKEYLIYCRSGRRSTAAVEVFRKLGFESVAHLDGGYQAWVGAGKPVEK